MKNLNVKRHRGLVRLPVSFKNEVYINWLGRVEYEFNQLIEKNDRYEIVEMKLSEIRSILNLNTNKDFVNFLEGFNSDLKEYMRIFHVDKGERLTGDIFLGRITESQDMFEIALNPFYRKYIFFKNDIENMVENKKRKKTGEELIGDIEKHKNLVVEDLTILNNISGKYNKILFRLLNSCSMTGKFFMKIEDFKNCLDIPKSYSIGKITERILNPCKKELLKHGFKISEIKKIKTGRTITKIEIFFNKVEPVINNKKIEKKIVAEKRKFIDMLIEEYGVSITGKILPMAKEIKNNENIGNAILTIEQYDKFKIENKESIDNIIFNN